MDTKGPPWKWGAWSGVGEELIYRCSNEGLTWRHLQPPAGRCHHMSASHCGMHASMLRATGHGEGCHLPLCKVACPK